MHMRKIIKLITFCMVFSLFSIINVNADELNPPISIDGVFDDWSNTPSLIDPSGDGTNNHEDLKAVKYITDDQYLYLFIERYPVDGEYNGNGLWDIWIPIINGNRYGAHNCFFPWDRKDGEVWRAQSVSTFKVVGNFKEKWDQQLGGNVKLFEVRIKINGESVGEDYLFKGLDGSKIEIKLPLSKVGLSGNDEVVFSVGSDIGAANEYVDWIDNNGPITSTQGPIFGVLTGALIIAAFVWVGMKSIK